MANEITALRQAALQPAQARPAANAPAAAQAQQGSEPAAADTVTLTDSGRLLQRLEAAVARVPAVDAQRVAHIKEQITSGAYQVDPQRLAAQVAQFEQDLPGPQREIEFARTDNGYTIDVSTTTARGTRERSVTVGYDPATNSLSRDVTMTGAHGEQVSRHGSITVSDDGYLKQVSFTGRDGETERRSLELRHDPQSGSLTRVATADGERYSYMRTTQIARAESGELVHKTKVERTPNGIS
jgi:negative regulator of flagellin synthesis FlgM